MLWCCVCLRRLTTRRRYGSQNGARTPQTVGRLFPRNGPIRQARIRGLSKVEQQSDQQFDVLPDELLRRGCGGFPHCRVSPGLTAG